MQTSFAIGATTGMAVGAKAGAMLGAKLGVVAGGPVGMAIGVACGALGGIIGGWLLGTAGKKGRDLITKGIRAKKAEKVVFPAIDTFISNVKTEYGKLIQGYQQAVDQSIESWGTSQKQTFQKEQDARKKIRRSTEDEKVKHRASLLKDKQTLEEVIQTLESK